MVMADNIDNKLRKMILDIAYPKAKVRGGDMGNISYGNISDKIISVGVDVWVKALGLKESVELGERTSPLPKATAFSLLFSYAGKDHKFVSKLTDIGGKLDRKKKEVYFDFNSAAARTKFRKKYKDIIKSLSESVELDERRKDVYAIVDKKGKVVAANLTRDNSGKESSNRGGQRKGFTIVLDPDAKVGDVLKTFARKESVRKYSRNESTDKFAGSMVFSVTPEEYDKCFHGRSKNERWKRKLNMDEMERCDIRTYHHKNPGKSIIVQNERTGEMTYLVKAETNCT
jgi:hypothetical protein